MDALLNETNHKEKRRERRASDEGERYTDVKEDGIEYPESVSFLYGLEDGYIKAIELGMHRHLIP